MNIKRLQNQKGWFSAILILFILVWTGWTDAVAQVPTGAIDGLFSVSKNTQVYFSQGNLQYIGSAGNGDENNTGAYWKFAEHQWDYLGDNGQGSNSKNVDRDLFGWGTSGYNHGANCYQPWSTSESYSDYYAYGSDTNNLFDQTGQADWGYNAISDGGNQENSGWRTLTRFEWDYLFYTRTSSSGIRYAKATVNNVAGVILLPDDWSADYYTLSSTNTSNASFSTNVITASQWATLEQHGAVFLPAAGGRYGTSVYNVGSYGSYWSSSSHYSSNTICASFGNGSLDTYSVNRSYGYSVRLVRAVENYSIQATPNPAEGGAVSGAGAYMAGAECTLTATPNEGYTFINWTENGEVVSMEATYTFTMTGDRELVANFALQGSSTVPMGAINGVFSVGENTTVLFSQGNLQYIGSAGNGDENNTGAYWKFAEHQWDYLGDNGQGSDSITVDRDLFGWGTSGYNHGANCYQPWSTSTSYSDYYAYGSSNYNLFDQTGQADWGYNAISNGGNQENSGWRTLATEECEYLFNTRTTSSGIRYAKGHVNEINGVILLPDDWQTSYYSLNSPNTKNASFSTNVITVSQWAVLEQHGAVFLPAAGNRYGTSVRDVGSYGDYWSASCYDNYSAYYLDFGGGGLYASDIYYRYCGQSVRLVRAVENYSFGINATPNPVEGGAVSGAGAYMAGAECTLTATASAGYTFAYWTQNGRVVSADAAYTFTVGGNRNLVANFTLNNSTGRLNGLFSIGDNTGVCFSQGNLQYKASTNTWRFAENQWDYVGSDNSNISQTNNGLIDLFGWGTSGYNHGANRYQPWSTSTSSSDYYAYGNSSYNLFDQTGQADWGYNAISNGGNTENSGWRTLTGEEWDYLFNTRSTSSGIRFAMAKVNNINGVILLPDDWSTDYYTLNSTNTYDASFSTNVITVSQWAVLEQHGAVFLPAAGGRYGTSVYDVGGNGYYWSASYCGSDYAYLVYFYVGGLVTNGIYDRLYGPSVRLVRTVENYSIHATPNPTEGGAVSGAGAYMSGAECTLTAMPNEGYTFINWTENGEVVSTEATYTFTVTGDRELVANFALQGSSTVPTGALNGLFSVGENTTVLFSQGNLQYIGSAGNGDENNTGAYWKFAEHQWDYLGNNGQGSNSKTVDRDLFGWGTSGYNHGANCYQPWSTSTSNSDYYAYGNSSYNLFDQTGQANWGYNAISNGGNTTNTWRTLTRPEWNYLFNTRGTGSGIRYAKAQVNNVNGVILLPDDWSTDYYTLNSTNTSGAGYSTNVITASQWATLEQHGAVFLPAAGYRFGTSVFNVGSYGYYWSASHIGSSSAYYAGFNDGYLNASSGNNRYYGQSVRLVRTVENYSIHATPNPAEGGAVSGAGAYMAGAECTLTATPNEGYTFINWTENGEVVSTESTYSFIVTGDRELVASFEETIPTDNCWSDDFNDGVINPEMWLYTGNNVYEEDGLLKMDQNITDQNVCLLSMPMDVDDDQIITLERKFYLHRGSDYAYPRFAIEFNGETGIHGCPLHADAWDGSISNEWGVDYIGIVYGHTDWEDKYGIYVEAGVGSEIHGIRLCDAVFDTWLTEEVVVDIAAGTLSYYLEDSFVATVVIPGLSTLPISYFTWISSPWGWWTGHQHYMDYIHVCGLGDHVSEITAAAEPAQGGTVTGGGTFDFGSTCTLTATPSQGYTFMYWTDNGKVVSSEPNYAFAVYGDHDFVAHFSLPLNITATANPAVGGTVTGTGVFAYNSECTLTATPNDGYTFINWTENGEVVSTETTYTFTVTGDRALVANFVEGYGCDISFNFFDSYGDGWNGNTLVVNTDYGLTRELTLDGGSSGTQTLNLIDGHHVTLTWIEGGWTYECSFTVSDSNGNVFYVGTNLNGTSYEFDWDCEGMPALTFDINASANPEEGGVVMGEGTYVYNTTCTLNATPKEGYAFVNWTENGEVVSTETTYTFMVTGDRELVANFALQGSSYLTSLSDDFNDGVIDPELWTYTGTHVLEEDGLLKLQQNVTDNYTALETLPMSVPVDNKIVIDRSFFLHEQPRYWNGGDRYFCANVFIKIDGSDDNYIGIIYYDYDWDDYGATTDRHGTYIRSQIDGVTSEEIRICDVLFDTWMTEQIVVDLTTNTLSYYRDEALIATVDIPSVQPNSYTIRFKPDGWWTGHQHYMDYININMEPTSFVAQNTSLNEGWNWYSTFIELNGFGGLNLIKDGLGQNGVAIKSQQDGFLLYDNDLWMGNLNTMNNESMYLIDVNAPSMVSLTGTAATPEQHPITLAPGWNWIGYPSSMATDINTALSNLEAQDGDVVKIQNAFSQYEEGLGWTGGLNTLTPGDGIMFHSVRNQQVNFVYANGSKADALLKNITPAGNHFVPDLHVYPFNMSVMAVVELDGAELRDNRYELAAFAGNECRGSARLQYVEGLDRFIAFLTVAGDEIATLRWKLYDAETGQTYGNDQETVFEADAILGGVKNPMTLRFNSGTALTGEWLSQTCLYPNPVEANALFRIDLPANVLEKKSVEIVNALGVTVKAMTLTGSSVTLKAPKVPGVYMVKITFGNNGGYSYKLIVK